MSRIPTNLDALGGGQAVQGFAAVNAQATQSFVNNDNANRTRQLAQSLGSLSGSFGRLQQANANLERAQTAEQLDEGRRAFARGIKRGDIDEQDSPFFVRGYQQAKGAALATDYRDLALQQYNSSPLAQNPDATDEEIQEFFDKAAAEVAMAGAGEDGFADTFFPNAAQIRQNLVSGARARRNEQQVARATDIHAARLNDIFSDETRSTAEKVKEINAFRKAQREVGFDGTTSNRITVDQAAEAAITSGNPELFDELIGKISGGSGPLSKTKYAIEVAPRIKSLATRRQAQNSQEATARQIGLLRNRIGQGGVPTDLLDEEVTALKAEFPGSLTPQQEEALYAANRTARAQTNQRAAKAAEDAQLAAFTDELAAVRAFDIAQGTGGVASLSTPVDVVVQTASGQRVIKGSDIQKATDRQVEEAAQEAGDPFPTLLNHYSAQGRVRPEWKQQITGALSQVSTARIEAEGGVPPVALEGVALYNRLFAADPAHAAKYLDNETAKVADALRVMAANGIGDNDEDRFRLAIRARENREAGLVPSLSTAHVESAVQAVLANDNTYLWDTAYHPDAQITRTVSETMRTLVAVGLDPAQAAVQAADAFASTHVNHRGAAINTRSLNLPVPLDELTDTLDFILEKARRDPDAIAKGINDAPGLLDFTADSFIVPLDPQGNNWIIRSNEDLTSNFGTFSREDLITEHGELRRLITSEQFEKQSGGPQATLALAARRLREQEKNKVSRTETTPVSPFNAFIGQQ